MKINKDLIDATLMLALISLVLVGTTEFSDALMKDITLGGIGLLAFGMIVLRIIDARRKPDTSHGSEGALDYEYE